MGASKKPKKILTFLPKWGEKKQTCISYFALEVIHAYLFLRPSFAFAFPRSLLFNINLIKLYY